MPAGIDKIQHVVVIVQDDHVVPPVVGGRQLGLRMPALVISPYARHGVVDHQTLSFDNYLRFIEDRFLGACASTRPPTAAATRDQRREHLTGAG